MHLINSYQKVIIKVAGTPLPKSIGLRSPKGYTTDLTVSKNHIEIEIAPVVETLDTFRSHSKAEMLSLSQSG